MGHLGGTMHAVCSCVVARSALIIMHWSSKLKHEERGVTQAARLCFAKQAEQPCHQFDEGEPGA